MARLKSRRHLIMAILGVAIFLAAFGVALAATVFQATRQVPSDLTFSSVVIADAKLGVFPTVEATGAQVNVLHFRGAAFQPPLHPRVESLTVFLKNLPTNPPTNRPFTIIEPCRDIFATIDGTGSGVIIGFMAAAIFDLEGKFLGDTCDRNVVVEPNQVVQARLHIDKLDPGLATNVVHNFTTVFGAVGEVPELRGTALATLYPTAGSSTLQGGEEAVPGDLVILQIATNTPPTDIHLATSVIGGRSLNFIEASRFHPALRGKWGVSPEAQFLLPVEVPEHDPGLIQVQVTITDNFGNIAIVTPSIKVVPGRNKFAVYLMPGFNYISTPLLSFEPGNAFTFASAPATGSLVSAGLLLQDVTNFVAASFLTLLNQQDPNRANKTHVFLSDVVEVIFGFPGGGLDTPFQAFSPGPALDDLAFRAIEVGKGYIFLAREEAFKTHPPAVPGITARVPQPIPLVFAGEVLHPGQVPPTHPVFAGLNLVGLHSNTDTFVDLFLRNVQPPAVATREWLVLFEFVNSLGVTTRAGAVQGDPADALTLVLGGFQGRRSATDRPGAPQGDPVSLGSGLCLFMVGDGLLLPVINGGFGAPPAQTFSGMLRESSSPAAAQPHAFCGVGG